MGKTDMLHHRRMLIDRARAVCDEFPLASGGYAASVGAALETPDGAIFTGVCIDMPCGLGFCAEASAIAAMITARQTRISMIVAVTRDVILPPCGRCREMMAMANLENMETLVILGYDECVALRELLPRHWLGAWKSG